MTTTAPPLPSPARQVEQWNKRVAVGDWVEYRSVKDLSAPQRFQTRSEATVLSGHTAVVWLAGKSGCVCIDHCTRIAL